MVQGFQGWAGAAPARPVIVGNWASQAVGVASETAIAFTGVTGADWDSANPTRIPIKGAGERVVAVSLDFGVSAGLCFCTVKRNGTTVYTDTRAASAAGFGNGLTTTFPPVFCNDGDYLTVGVFHQLTSNAVTPNQSGQRGVTVRQL